MEPWHSILQPAKKKNQRNPNSQERAQTIHILQVEHPLSTEVQNVPEKMSLSNLSIL